MKISFNIKLNNDHIESYINEQIKKSPEYTKEIKKYYTDDQNKYKLHEDMTNQKLYKALEEYFINTIKESSTSKLRKNKKG